MLFWSHTWKWYAYNLKTNRIHSIEQTLPENFTVFSAAEDQTSKPQEEAKHGMFSYSLMKGDADTNNDYMITARELHAHVKRMLCINLVAHKILNYKVIKTEC